ncbi:SgcJ/EcaC family oxidoreductase [Cryptosporangium japonicum]|uniref:DUF4440 domain-containing protein n=1 Tax=Cryptosporangium japonicum TaxID=80872 RepID=A0ABN0V4Z5_9ACTN
MEQSLEALGAIPLLMNEAWNRGDVDGFLADFADDVVFVEPEGTIYTSREEALRGHRVLMDTVLKGTKLVHGEVKFARLVSPGVGVVHSRAAFLMPGEDEPPATRYSMQLFVAEWRDDRWVVVALETARLLSMDMMAFLETMPAS